jgi:hypothetical protein
MVPVAGLEPALLSEQDFESSASTNSTTPAQVWEARNLAAEFAGSIDGFRVQEKTPERRPNAARPLRRTALEKR